MMIGDVFVKIKGILLDIFFPKFCVSCRKEGRYLCQDCLLFLSEALPVCPVCLKTEYYSRRHKKCKKKNELDGLVALYDYEGLIKKLIYQTKYESLIEIPHELIEYGFLAINNNKERFYYFLSFLYDEKTIITYVPLSKTKEHERGFNQSEEAAKVVARFTNKKVFSLLLKQKENKPQKNLNKKDRQENVRGVFSINLDTCEIPQRVIVVDDVYTSGATLKECTKVLKEAGVKEAWGFVLARVP